MKKARLILALLVLSGSTAFAPAPFAKPERRGERDRFTLRSLQGDWRVVSFDEVGYDGELETVKWFEAVRVEGDRLRCIAEGQIQRPHRIAVDGTRRPAAIDFYRFEMPQEEERPYLIGIVGRDGHRVKILYWWARGNHHRPTSFESLPPKWWILVLERG